LADRKLGVISSGVAHQYAREVFKNASHLKLVTTYPVPAELVRKFAKEVEKVVVVEELDPYIEEAVRGLGIPVTGKEFIPIIGELNPEIVEKGAIEAGLISAPEARETKVTTVPLPPRPPLLCPGCPHVAAEFALKRLGVIVVGDIGCYTLGVYPPLSVLDTTVCMGASIGQALGLEKAGVTKKMVALIGDSTFIHSGITPLIDVVYNQGKTKVVILDNGTTAMTGHQEHPGTGITAKGAKTQQVKLEDIVRGIGIEDVSVVDAFNLKEITSTIRRCLETPKPAVVIVRGDCPLHLRVKGKPFQIDTAKCNNCKTCLRLGCSALFISDDEAWINPSLCQGSRCGLCTQICPKKAIKEGE
ncbi:MAG: thiamine pyrophosphate-dependent enzyme, partial [Dehalococcoidales bacterium]|nr:thiamine pyrophosphate-dependent enzyme [Dehalococcoidales bacterium]